MYGISVLISPLNMSRPEVISLHCECFIYEKLIHKHPRNTKTAPVQIRKKKNRQNVDNFLCRPKGTEGHVDNNIL